MGAASPPRGADGGRGRGVREGVRPGAPYSRTRPKVVIARLTEALTPPQVIQLACVAGFWRMYDSIHESVYVPVENELHPNSEEALRSNRPGAKLVLLGPVAVCWVAGYFFIGHA